MVDRLLSSSAHLSQPSPGAAHTADADAACGGEPAPPPAVSEDQLLAAAETMVRRLGKDAASVTGSAVEWDDARAIIAAGRIAAARKSRGLTQAELGAMVGMPQSQVSRIERGPDRTRMTTLRRLARALRVDVAWLVG